MPRSGHDVSVLGSLQEVVEKILNKRSGLGPLDILRSVHDGLDVAGYPVCAEALRLLIEEIKDVSEGHKVKVIQ